MKLTLKAHINKKAGLSKETFESLWISINEYRGIIRQVEGSGLHRTMFVKKDGKDLYEGGLMLVVGWPSGIALDDNMPSSKRSLILEELKEPMKDLINQINEGNISLVSELLDMFVIAS